MRKRKHRSSKHHQSGKDVKRQKQEQGEEQQQSQYWTAEKKRTVGIVEPRVVIRIPKKHLNEPNGSSSQGKFQTVVTADSEQALQKRNHLAGHHQDTTGKTCSDFKMSPTTVSNGLKTQRQQKKNWQQNDFNGSSSGSFSSSSESERYVFRKDNMNIWLFCF